MNRYWKVIIAIVALVAGSVVAIWTTNKSPKQQPSHTLSAVGIPPPLNPNWSVAAWFVDPQNTTTCASDDNSCTSATCGAAGSGVGPCKTWGQINAIRWGCLGSPVACPRLRQTTTITFLSSHTDDTDPVESFPSIEHGGSLIFTANLTQTVPSVGTSTFTTVINYSNSSATNQAANDTGQLIGNKGAMVVDMTKSATFWCNEGTVNGSHICRMTVPMGTVTAPPTALQVPSLFVNMTGGAGAPGLASGDTYVEYVTTNVNIVAVKPIIADWSAAAPAIPTNGVFLYHLNIFDPSGTPGTNTVRWGAGVIGLEIHHDRVIDLDGNPGNNDDGCVNCSGWGGAIGGRLSSGHSWHYLGGEFSSTTVTTMNITGMGVIFDGLAMYEGAATFPQGVTLGLVFFPFSTLTFWNPVVFAPQTPGYGSGTIVQNGVWMNGISATLNQQHGAFRYDSSHSGSVNVFIGSPTFECETATVAESHSGTGTVTVTNNIIINTTNLDNPASATAFGGHALCGSASWEAL